VPGAHNVLNAQAALAVARFLGVPLKKAQKSVQKFSGTWRRFELKGKTQKEVKVYDDYAHHPTEIQATLRAARERFPESRLSVIFQPHLYSRTQSLLGEFAESFNDADRVILLPIYAAREKKEKSFKPKALVDALKKKHPHVIFAKDFKTAGKEVLKDMGKEDVVMTMGAGDVYKIADKLVSSRKTG
jgi:UDP-N-acetylmuramate--alanine ligase